MVIIFRTDGGAEDGMGHVFRCLTLAGAFRARGFEPVFVCHAAAGAAAIEARGFRVLHSSGIVGSDTDVTETKSILSRESAQLLVVDSKRADSAYFAALASCGTRTLLVDDELLRDLPVDLILNYNVWANAAHYPRRAGGDLLIGPRYNLVNPAFFGRAAGERRRGVLVTFGGEDPHNHSSQTLQNLGDLLRNASTTVVIGPAHPQPDQVEADARQHVPSAKVLRNAKNMPELMADCAVAITACGTTTYELCAMRVAQLGVVIEEHQRILGEAMTAQGCMELVGDYNGLDVEKAKRLLADWLANPERAEYRGSLGSRLFSGPGADEVVTFAASQLGSSSYRRSER